MAEELRSGYTTGTHATAIFLASLYEYFQDLNIDTLEVVLPKGDIAKIEVQKEKTGHFFTFKTDNDDLDVTKGCKISLELLNTVPHGLKEQIPSLIEIKGTEVHVYAGEGIGVATKKGLKIDPGYPAINPTPLEMMRSNAQGIVSESRQILHAVFSVENGEEIAKETANAKVGVIGGISILGTRGIVKPVSASAYIDSVETEIDVAAAQNLEYIIFTLGNTAHDYALARYDETNVVEIANFVYEASARLKRHDFKKMVFVCSTGKMCKVAQGCKNTHNRFGSIDFTEVRQWLQEDLAYDLGKEEYVTLKAVLQSLSPEIIQDFIKILGYKSALMYQKWFKELELGTKHLEIITLHGKNDIKEELTW
ncbi:cobalt-precorrin-5B (C(1))-methyltransferase [Sulfurimonas sp. MAG313]|nr:cobalt-precorrin-5B (C(1))-methyltransferase CbiD [Sulfurimonas sp. MAG313]MDF1881997.1 cobalt-precorrin-5B (C(1))-methyltransferase [Sulfurimonas sp. MAG313]